jgi:hypothetical protein
MRFEPETMRKRSLTRASMNGHMMPKKVRTAHDILYSTTVPQISG